MYLLFPASITTLHHHSQAQLDAGIDLVLPEAAQTKQTAGGFGISLILITLLLFLCIRRARRAAQGGWAALRKANTPSALPGAQRTYSR